MRRWFPGGGNSPRGLSLIADDDDEELIKKIKIILYTLGQKISSDIREQ